MAQVFDTPDKNTASAKSSYNPYKTASGTSTYFDARLAAQLTADHQQLLQQVQSIRDALRGSDYVVLRELLSDFRITLQAHLLTENVKLYVYLAGHLARDGSNARKVEGFREEMVGIGRMVMDFLRRYSDTPLKIEQVPVFREELDAVANILARRLQREEAELFPLYLPSY